MPSARDKRAAARARLEQRMAEKATAARKRRKIQVTLASALAVVLVLGLGTLLAVTLINNDDPAGDTTASGNCTYTVQQNDGTNPNMVATGTPESTQPSEGTQDFTMQTNHGDVTVQMDLKAAPCTAGSFAFLAGQNYYTGSVCHRLTTSGLFVLQCGDPSGTGMGGPSFSVGDENLPTPDETGSGDYPAGTVAMAEGQGQDPGSQFFIVYKDTQIDAAYTIVGTVTKGLDVVDKIAKAGIDGSGADGKPKKAVKVTTATVGPPMQSNSAPKEPEPSTEPSKS